MKKKLSVSINKKIEKFNKKIKIPGDKSCSIRAVLFASQCIGISKIKNLLESEDVLNCINTLKTSLGVKIIKKNNIYQVYGNGLNSFKVKKKNNKNLRRKFRNLCSTIVWTFINLSRQVLFAWRSINEQA